MKYSFDVRNVILILFCLMLLACSDEPIPSLEQVNADVLSKIDLYEKVAAKMLQSGVDRVSQTGVYPRDSMNEEDYKWLLEKFEMMGLNQGAQVDKNENIVEFIYWSIGIVSRGHSIVVLKSNVDPKYSNFYGEQIRKELMECKVIKNGWYSCSS